LTLLSFYFKLQSKKKKELGQGELFEPRGEREGKDNKKKKKGTSSNAITPKKRSRAALPAA